MTPEQESIVRDELPYTGRVMGPHDVRAVRAFIAAYDALVRASLDPALAEEIQDVLRSACRPDLAAAVALPSPPEVANV